MAEYAVDDEIAAFLQKSTATKSQCEMRAREITKSNKIEPVSIQCACSYTMYAGGCLEYVVQCRPRSMALESELPDLAATVYGPFDPTVFLHGKLGHNQDQESRKEPLLVYLMTRVPSITQSNFGLSRPVAQSPPDFFPFRKTLFVGIARHVFSFFARSWLTPQHVPSEYRATLRESYFKDLRLVHDGLPERFKQAIQACLRSLDNILALQMVLLNKDFAACNLIVDQDACHLNRIVDWAKASIGPFGANLHSVQAFAGSMHLRNGWSRFPDYAELEQQFRVHLGMKNGGLSEETVDTIKMARILGFLLSHGFTSRLANEDAPIPLRDDDYGRYNLMLLDGYLINADTKLDGALCDFHFNYRTSCLTLGWETGVASDWPLAYIVYIGHQKSEQ